MMMNRAEGSVLEVSDSPEGALDSQLVSALTEAQTEHHAYEQQLGHPDEDWAGWYAKHMAESLGNKYSEQDIKTLLLEANDAFTAQKPSEDWQTFYAKIMKSKLENGPLSYAGTVRANTPRVDDFMSGEVPSATKTAYEPKDNSEASSYQPPAYKPTNNQGAKKIDDFMSPEQ